MAQGEAALSHTKHFVDLCEVFVVSGEPLFSHGENFADLGHGGTTKEPRFSHRENFAIYCEDFAASSGYHEGATIFSQRKFCNL